MIKTRLFIATALAGAAMASAQTVQTGIAYQTAGVFGFPMGAAPEFMSPEAVTGSPMTATHQSHSVQVLGDGTRIERIESSKVYRDSLGRTRVESGAPGFETVMIHDPVNGSMVTLNPVAHTAQKMTAPRGMVTKMIAEGAATASGKMQAAAPTEVHKMIVMQGVPMQHEAMAGMMTGMMGGVISAAGKPAVETLEPRIVNGVMAAGRKTTLTIPVGQIGNDRAIQVVGETWYSEDLRMTVKSSNSDPRFGETTFELTGINRTEPDATLFQVPADYSLTDSHTMEYKVAGPNMEFKAGEPNK